MKLSVCMIVKNEEERIERCLSHIVDHADEIIVVDTGSTDNTVEIAESMGAIVKHFKWCDDFGSARNFSFSWATGDYIMWVDADEIVPQETMEQIRFHIPLEPIAISMYTVMCSPNMEPQGLRFKRNRVVKRDLNFKWIGFVHEYLAVPSLESVQTELEILHCHKLDGKPGRNLALYEKRLSQGFELSDRDMYYYGSELYYNGRYADAFNQLHEFIQKEVWIEDRLNAYLKIMDCSIRLGWRGELKHMSSLALELEPRAEHIYMLGNYYLDQGNIKTAIYYYESILPMDIPENCMGFVNKDDWDLNPYLQLVVAYHRLGNTSEAYLNHLRAKSINPTHPSVIHNEKWFDHVFNS